MMVSTLKPVTAVWCPRPNRIGLVPVEECKKCEDVIEVRRPWRHFIVKCKVGDKSEGAYP